MGVGVDVHTGADNTPHRGVLGVDPRLEEDVRGEHAADYTARTLLRDLDAPEVFNVGRGVGYGGGGGGGRRHVSLFGLCAGVY